MVFGIALLVMVILMSIIGSIIPQGREELFYLNNYSEGISKIILQFNLHDIYHSWYFVGLFLVLSINLILCSVFRVRRIINKIKEIPRDRGLKEVENLHLPVGIDKELIIKEKLLEYGFKEVKEAPGPNSYYSKRNNIGHMGSWLIHLGLLVIIMFYGYGQYYWTSTAVYGVAGSAMVVEGTSLTLNIEDFQVIYRDDGSLKQYITKALLLEDNIPVMNNEIYVNNPLRYRGYKFYQNSAGWAIELNYSDGKLQDRALLYEGGYYLSPTEEMALQFNSFYPDLVESPEGFHNKSQQPLNPAILYSVYYKGNRVAMGLATPGEAIKWNNYSFQLDKPQQYTYISVNRFRGKLGVGAGSLMITIGLVLAFYFKPSSIFFRVNEGKITILQ